RRGENPPGELPAPRDAASVAGQQAPAGASVRVGDDVHVDLARVADGPRPDARTSEQGEEPAPATGPENQLGSVLRLGEGEQGVGDFVADDLVVGAAE